LRGRHRWLHAQISGESLNLIPHDAVDASQTCVCAVSLRHAEALEGFFTTHVLLGKQETTV